MKWDNLLTRVAALGLCSLAVAEINTFSPRGQNDILYSIAVPAKTASSGSGPILFQIRAPTTFQWVSLGQGSRMAGSSIFLLYSSSSSQNVTLSPRSGTGHVEPEYDSKAQVSLLDGSGIEDGMMTANVRCDTCRYSSSSPWIFAYKEGSPLDSDSMETEIDIHDHFGVTQVDMSNAVSTDANPFLLYNASSTSDAAEAGGSSSDDILIAHGFVMSIAFVLLFPSFALLTSIPLPGVIVKVHAPLQTFALLLAAAGMGLGIKLGIDGDNFDDVHPILGLVVVGLLILFQPAMGLLQHLHFRRTGGKSVFGYLHQWLGRVLIILGIVNGGLGFRLSGIGEPGTPTSAVIAYSVIAGVIGLFYLIVQVARAMGGRRKSENSRPEGERKSSESSTARMETSNNNNQIPT